MSGVSGTAVGSAVGNVEGQRALSGSPLEDLSVEQLIECDKTEGVRQQDGEEYGASTESAKILQNFGRNLQNLFARR